MPSGMLNMLARHELDQTSLNLLAAADLLEKEGHTKGIRYSLGGYCALGAIGTVISDISNPWAYLNNNETVQRLVRHLDEIYKSPYYNQSRDNEFVVAGWNNKPERTAEEVISKFREVAYDPRYAKVTV